MLDLFSIFTKTGIVLFSHHGMNHVSNAPVNAFIRSVFIDEKTLEKQQFNSDKYSIRWTVVNELDLIFIAVYASTITLPFVDDLLKSVSISFAENYGAFIKSGQILPIDQVSSDFQLVLRDVSAKSQIESKQPKAMRSFEETKKFEKTLQASKGEDGKKDKDKDSTSNLSTTTLPEKIVNSSNSPAASEELPSVSSTSTADDKFQELLKKGVRPRNISTKPASSSSSSSSSSPKSPTDSSKSAKKPKQGRAWGDGIVPLSNSPTGPLDYSDSSVSNSNGSSSRTDMKEFTSGLTADSMRGDVPDMEYRSSDVVSIEEVEDEDDVEEDFASNTASTSTSTISPTTSSPRRAVKASDNIVPAKKSRFGGLMSFFKDFTGNKEITLESLASTLEKTKEHLVTKNVASDIAEKLCDAVRDKLVGKTTASFTSISATVTQALQESLSKILSPSRRIDILREILNKKQEGIRPYVVVFCGVNGVGKSTNLAKICYWLSQNKHKILIAACDTFRAGAVEQLRVHTRCLNDVLKENGATSDQVLLYEKGYGKDAASIAADAIGYGKENRCDVVLVDTAGRMQDNEPLMRSLAKLVRVNNPDLVLFVGEALVGNEAVDQLKKFNQSLADFSESETPHLIDGIVLTKFDTIDDKVGAAISMTYTSGQPIVFVGTGQTYQDLKKLNVEVVVKALMSS